MELIPTVYFVASVLMLLALMIQAACLHNGKSWQDRVTRLTAMPLAALCLVQIYLTVTGYKHALPMEIVGVCAGIYMLVSTGTLLYTLRRYIRREDRRQVARRVA